MPNLFKRVIDRMIWAQVAPVPNAHAAGSCIASDLRNDVSRHPYAFQLISNAILNRYNIISKGSQVISTTPFTAGTFAAGTTAAFVPSFAAVGTIAAGATTTTFTLTTALPTAVATNGLANRGANAEPGYKIRIIDTTAGKTEERYIVGNTSGTTPTIRVDSAFTFTPSTGARYELLSGRLFMVNAGTTAAGTFRTYEPATATLASRTTTNLPVTVATDSAFLVLDELYTPFDCAPGEGMIKGTTLYDANLNSLVATSSAASTITGQASAGDSAVTANEYRNFQIRIVGDATTPASVGQRRIIASHTAGPSAVYTLGTAWATQPSATARFVIEQPNLLVLRSSASTTTFAYNYTDATINNGTNSIAADAWSTTYFAVGPAVNAAGNLWLPSFGIQPDVARNARHSFNYFWRGSAVTLDLFDIAGSITGTWTGAITYDGILNSFVTGTTGTYAPFSDEGRYGYINIYVASALNQIYRFDVKNRILAPYVPTDFIQTGTATQGSRMAAYVAIDGTDKYSIVFLQSHLSTVTQELIPLA